MRVINIPSLETSYIFTLRSGSSLLMDTMVDLCRVFDIFCETQSGIISESKKIFFVRNPIDRFFSTYYYYNSTFTGVTDFIKNYPNLILETQDRHILPQICDFMEKSIFGKSDIDLRHEFKKTYTKNSRFVKIESITNTIEKSLVKKDSDLITFDFEESINFIPKKMIRAFVPIFYYYENYYDGFHHKKVDFRKHITEQDYKTVVSFFKKESDLFGYVIDKHKKDEPFSNTKKII